MIYKSAGKQTDVFDLLKATKKELNYMVACIMQSSPKSAEKYTERVSKVLASKIVGAATTTGLLSLVSAFGTASTGTAIATLSGAAATSAKLAWVGSIIGGGVAAGTFLTGGLTLVVGFSVYKILGSKARKLEELTKVEMQIIETCIVLIKAIDEQKSPPSRNDILLIHEHSIQPLYELIVNNKEDLCARLDFTNRMALRNRAIPRYKKKVLDVFANPNVLTGLK